MDFGLTEEQKLIRDGARQYLRATSTGAYVRAMAEHETGCHPDVWRQIAEMGWTGLNAPESHGGAGLGLVELALVIEEMGAVAFPGPFFATAVLGVSALKLAGNHDQQADYLPRIARGSLLATVALESTAEALATRSDSGWRLRGRANFVPEAGSAGVFVLPAREARTGATMLVAVPRESAGLNVARRWNTVAHDRLGEITMADTPVAADAVLNGADASAALHGLRQIAAGLKAVEMVGGAGRVLEMTVEYARKREQFGRPIGSFQAVQHMIAEMAIQVGSTRQLVYQAVWLLERGEGAGPAVGLAKLRANEACVQVCELAHQCHGAIGFTEEHDLQLYTRAALDGRASYGDSRAQRDAALATLGL